MRLTVSLFLLISLLAGSVGATGGASIAGTNDGRALQVEQTELDADRVLLQFDVREDGTAVATVEYRFEVTESNVTDTFDRLQRDIERNQTAYLDRFERRMNGTIETAANATGRAMEMENASVTAEARQIPRPHGVVAYTFIWHGFASTEGGDLRIGDALAGLYIDENVTLRISWPSGHELQTAGENTANQGSDSTAWTGPLWFDQQGPHVVTTEKGLTVEPIPAALFALSAVCALAGFAFWWRARGDDVDAPPGPVESPAVGPNPDGGTTASPAESTVDDPDLLSNEERVLEEIRRQGGRIKQQELVSELEWSDAKVSRAVGTLRERGAIEGFRLGNENVLSLASDDAEDEQ